MEKQISFWTYSRGEAARDLPYQLWRMIEDANDWDHIMYGHECVEDSRVLKHGDLVDWMTMFLSEKRVWNMIVDNATGDICGLGWYANFQNDSATCHIWMAPQYRGKPHSRDAVKLGIDFGHNELGISVLLAFTPFPLARNLARRAGFKDVCFIPHLFGHDVWLLEHKKEI